MVPQTLIFFLGLQPEKKEYFENPYFCPEQWSMVRPTTYLASTWNMDVWMHGLWMPNEAFFYQNSKLLGLDRQIGQVISLAFSAKLSAPILVL